MAVSIRKRTIFKHANCLSTDNIGDMVYLTGPSVGGLLSVAKIDIDAIDPKYAFGMIVAKSTSTFCTVQKEGEVKDIYSGLQPGKTLWVDHNARLNHDVPSAPGLGVRLVQRAALALDVNLLFINIQQPLFKIP